MTWTVVWRPSAESRLAELRLEVDDRDPLAASTDSIDALLRSHPEGVGEARHGSSRIFIVPPLVV